MQVTVRNIIFGMPFPKAVVFLLIAEQRLICNHRVIGFCGLDLLQQGFASEGIFAAGFRSQCTAIGNKCSAVYREDSMVCIQVQRLHKGIAKSL